MSTATQIPAPLPTQDEHGWTHRDVAANGVRLHLVEAGAGAPVVLLHGFPEFWYSWRHQLEFLPHAGFRALAPDLRGYDLSDKPPHVNDYRAATLVADVADLIRREAGGKAHVVGHDWGGVIAWRLAQTHPELVDRLAILNAPHPAAFAREMRRNPFQWLRSFYIALFQLPGVAERLIRARDYAVIRRALRRQPVHPGAFPPAEINEYVRALDRPGALTAALNYYRAAVRHRRDLTGEPQAVRAPTLLIWGMQDAALSSHLSEGLERWVADLRVVRIADASHFVQNDTPERVNHLLADFLAGR